MSKTVLITGCSTGLGRSTARHFAAQGWNVIATMRQPDPSLAEANPDRLIVAALDVTDPPSIKAAIAAGVERFGGLDAVVNNAGVSVVSVFEATAPETIRRVFDTNVFGPMNVISAALPHLQQAGGGAIVNVSSGVGFVAVPLLSLYVSSKWALEGFSESIAYELESQGILVRLVEPGAIRTTNFSANTMAATQLNAVPDRYQAYFAHALQAMMNYPFEETAEQAVVDTIYRATIDRSPRLRYPVGPDIEAYAQLRWSTSEDTYRTEMARLVGQDTWRATFKTPA